MKAAAFGAMALLAVVGFSATEALRGPAATSVRSPAESRAAGTAKSISASPEAAAPASNGMSAAAVPPAGPALPKPRLAVAFQLDPEVTGGIFLGTRWVSPPSWFFAQQGRQYVVRAKAQSIDSDGDRIDLDGNWSVSDPQMIAVSRGRDGVVTITVREPGDSRMTVTAGQDSKLLQVHATRVADAMQVRITQ